MDRDVLTPMENARFDRDFPVRMSDSGGQEISHQVLTGVMNELNCENIWVPKYRTVSLGGNQKWFATVGAVDGIRD
jgi:hypothetical protein